MANPIIKTVTTRTVISPSINGASLDFYMPSDIQANEVLKINRNTPENYQINNDKSVYSVVLRSKEKITIPTGIYVNMSKTSMLIPVNTNTHIENDVINISSAVFNSKDEIMVTLMNTGKVPLFIKANGLIARFVLVQNKQFDIEEQDIPLSEFYGE